MYKSFTFVLVALSILASLQTYSATPKLNELGRRTVDWNKMSQSLTRRSTVNNLQLTETPTCITTANATIDPLDCFSGLRDYLKKKDDDWIVQVRSTNVKSCRTCKVRLRTSDDGEILV
ncbi:hypothetical protein CROQUDRAFT_343568 [Cronartium quercuum f. sp. fusiforme G11]|uniref:Uncharacterized protein n=1 Tax=Cronartium quercuum f. sp. fusiforme G11 TaxID=708437 RepID=A0A9P6T6Q3_9BASI|nr:hypothetical protein CROQUDRAFT_343568 [Cronartium quercuum f. sp. fusiforme G11]